MSESLFSLKDKFILITGASSGIGLQCAITFSKYGARVALFGRDQHRLEETLGMMEQPSNHVICSVDLLEYEKIADVVKVVVSRQGPIEGVVNCAGISTTLPLNAISPGKMEEFFRINVIGAVNLTRNALKLTHFSVNGGSIIFISSVMGVTGESGKSLYSMTKGALISAVRSMAIELATRKIRVNSISPGVVDTPMTKHAVYSKDEGSMNKIKSLHPLGLGQPADVVNACLFLSSDAARWITGTNLIVDGGYSAK
jgi:NAD(P)-dependent dehydrogenase (short-subunit alcohol dehydrogenase family)